MFAKSTENPTNKVNVKTVATRKQYLRCSFRRTFIREKQICNEAIAIEKEQLRINLKPIYIATHMLELSKVLM